MWCVEFFQNRDLFEQVNACATLPGFDSNKAACEAGVRLQALLSRNHDMQSVELSKILSNCTQGAPCESAACPICDRMFRVKLVAKASRRIARDEADWFAISIVPPHLGFHRNRLHEFDLVRLKDTLRKEIAASELSGAPAIGGIGLAIQVIKRRAFWRPYLSAVMRTSDKNPIRNVFARHYEPTPSTPQPVYVRRIDKAALLIDGLGNNDPEVNLESDQWCEIVPLLHNWGFKGRLICRNWRLS